MKKENLWDRIVDESKSQGEWGKFSKFVSKHWDLLLTEDYEHLNETVLNRILDLLASPQFQAAQAKDETWVLLNKVESEWERLSGDHKQKLLSTLEAGWPHFQDWMWPFSISEFMEKFADGEGLATVQRLKAVVAVEQNRWAIPHAFEHIVRGATDSRIAQQAYEELMTMIEEPDEQVRYEANLSLRRLKTRGLVPE